MTDKLNRRWFQYSLRTLLVLMILACIGMSWVAVRRAQEEARRKRQMFLDQAGEIMPDGCVLLNVTGAGYRKGDIVRVTTDKSKISRGDVVLYDWRKSPSTTGGWGPHYVVGTIVGMPKEQVDLRPFAQHTKLFRWNWDRAIFMVPAGCCLLERDKALSMSDLTAIEAIITAKIDHDDEAEKFLEHVVY